MVDATEEGIGKRVEIDRDLVLVDEAAKQLHEVKLHMPKSEV